MAEDTHVMANTRVTCLRMLGEMHATNVADGIAVLAQDQSELVNVSADVGDPRLTLGDVAAQMVKELSHPGLPALKTGP